MRIHLARMDTRIGATSESEWYLLAENHSQCLLHRLLNSNTIGLALRAVKGSAIVCKANEITHNSCL